MYKMLKLFKQSHVETYINIYSYVYRCFYLLQHELCVCGCAAQILRLSLKEPLTLRSNDHSVMSSSDGCDVAVASHVVMWS